MAEVEAPKKASRKPSALLYVAVGSALLGAVSMGTVLGWSSPAILNMSQYSSDPELEYQNLTWISSCSIVESMVGVLSSGQIDQILGRKIALIIYGVPMIVGFISLWVATNMSLVIVGRFLTCFSAGLISGTAPSYVFEISTENLRGMFCTAYQLCVTIGILFVYVFGAFITWKWLSFLCIFPALAMSVLMLLMPETPIWLMTKSGGDFSKGSAVEKALKKLRDESNDNESELKEIAESIAQASNSKYFSLKDIKNPLFYKPFIISNFLMFFQQFSGINAVIFNAAFFSYWVCYRSVCFCGPRAAVIIIGVAHVTATLVGALLVNHLGRKIQLIVSSVGQTVSLGLLVIYFWVNMKAGYESQVPMLWLTTFIISFSLGWGPLPWLIIAEITPMEFISAVNTGANCVSWGCTFLITFNFIWLLEQTSLEFTFFLFTFFSVVSIPFVILFLPETNQNCSMRSSGISLKTMWAQIRADPLVKSKCKDSTIINEV